MSKYLNINYTTPHYSTKLFKAYHEYLTHTGRKNIFTEICQELAIEPDYLTADDNWVSNSFTNSFVQLLKAKTGEENIAYNVGKFTLSPLCINAFEFTLIKLLPPYLFFTSLSYQSKKLNRFHEFSITSYMPGHLKLNVTSTSNEQTCEDFEENTRGVLNSISSVHQFKKINITASKKSENNFLFEINYSFSIWHKLKSLIIILAYITALVYLSIENIQLNSLATKSLIFTSCILLVSFSYLFRIFTQMIAFHFIYHNSSHKKTEEIQLQKIKLNRRYQELNLIRELSDKLIKENNPEKIIHFALEDLEKRFGFNKSLIMLLNNKKTKLSTFATNGFQNNTVLENLILKYPAEKADPQIFSNILDAGKTINIDINSFKEKVTEKNKQIIDEFSVTSMIASPIEVENRKYGLLLVGSLNSEKSYSQEDAFLIDQVSKVLSLYFDKAQGFRNESILRQIFQKYVPSVVLEKLDIYDENNSGTLRSESKEVTSMFIDLRDFTQTSDMLLPEQALYIINQYCDYVCSKIANWGGIIDNIVGDGIVAFYPEDKNFNHAEAALSTALDIIANIEQFHSKLSCKGFPPLPIGIGLHSGPAVIGNVGSEQKFNYTAIGDTINQASRIESISKKFLANTDSANLGNIVFSEGVLEHLKNSNFAFEYTNLGAHILRGKQIPLNLFMMDFQQAKNSLPQLTGKKVS